MKRKNNGGFTLIEAMVSMVVVGIVGALMISGFTAIYAAMRADGTYHRTVQQDAGDIETGRAVAGAREFAFDIQLSDETDTTPPDTDSPGDGQKFKLGGLFLTRKGEGYELSKFPMTGIEEMLMALYNQVKARFDAIRHDPSLTQAEQAAELAKQGFLFYANNDNFLDILHSDYYGGEWPEFNAALLERNGIEVPADPLYIHVTGVQKTLSTAGETGTLVFANGSNTAHGYWYASLIYNPDDRFWYYKKSGVSFAGTNKEWKDYKAEIESTWKKLA